MRRHLRDYSLGYVLFALFVASWVGQTMAGWREFVAELAAHGQAATVFGPDGYAWAWAHRTLENWQSEFLQLFSMVVLTAFLLFKGSTESRDQADRIEAKIDELIGWQRGPK